MKKVILFLCYVIFFSSQAFPAENCFLAMENGKVLESMGSCSTAYAPESTFKIALSLIGFDAGILKNENYPSWSLPKNTDPYINVCKGNHNPRTWMRDSCLWYSRILTNQLGMQKFQNYVTKFSYGNTDLSGGLEDAWVSSSLRISPIEKIVNRKLPISKKSYEKTKQIMFIQEMAGGWKLYGKTGNGRQIDKEGNKTDLQHGWFVGYIEKGNRKIMFASHITDSEKQSIFASFSARNEALSRLWYLIDKIN